MYYNAGGAITILCLSAPGRYRSYTSPGCESVAIAKRQVSGDWNVRVDGRTDWLTENRQVARRRPIDLTDWEPPTNGSDIALFANCVLYDCYECIEYWLNTFCIFVISRSVHSDRNSSPFLSDFNTWHHCATVAGGFFDKVFLRKELNSGTLSQQNLETLPEFKTRIRTY